MTQELWSDSVGFLPHKVTVYENAERKLTLYLRWRERDADGSTNWGKLSLRRTLPRLRGKPDPAVVAWARAQAEQKYAELVKGVPTADRTVVHALSITEGIARLLNAETGKYPAATPHRREVERELKHVVRILGGDTRWDMIKKQELRRLWRHRIRELRAAGEIGYRGTEITVQRLLAAAAWLRDEEHIGAGACVAPSRWKVLLREDWMGIAGVTSVPEPERPRHSLKEMRAILAVTDRVDPRFGLLMTLAAELRAGQVLERSRRTDIDLEHKTLTVHGSKNKRGGLVKLTPGQLRAIKYALKKGYLRELEANLPDYYLFPAGQMPGGRSGRAVADVERHGKAGPIDRSVLDNWFKAAETLAEVPHVRGRGPYSFRRVHVDEAKRRHVSREGLKEVGLWGDHQTPDRIYADQVQDYARDEARDLRAVIRGERKR